MYIRFGIEKKRHISFSGGCASFYFQFQFQTSGIMGVLIPSTVLSRECHLGIRWLVRIIGQDRVTTVRSCRRPVFVFFFIGDRVGSCLMSRISLRRSLDHRIGQWRPELWMDL